MDNSISARWEHFISLCKEGIVGKWLGPAWLILGIWIVFRDDFWMPPNESKWRIINMIPHISLAWWIAGALAIICFWIFEASFRINKRLNETICSLRSQESPFEIIFDPTNPGRRFWSIEQAKDENGNQIAGTFWEYRAIIKNKSIRTVRNAKITVEAVGDLPTRPELSQFDINKKPLIDLTPDDEVLAVIRRWHNPPIVVGMVIGEGAYGPIKMTASADDVLPTTKVFQFDPMQTPMIWIIDVNPSTL